MGQVRRTFLMKPLFSQMSTIYNVIPCANIPKVQVVDFEQRPSDDLCHRLTNLYYYFLNPRYLTLEEASNIITCCNVLAGRQLLEQVDGLLGSFDECVADSVKHRSCQLSDAVLM